MTSNEIREAFLRFFEEKGHKVVASSSLVPQGDPTLLLTTAGMVQFKPYFTGEAIPPSVRLTSCQKCFRTTDIESVGNIKHLTFFEMLGNFSVGDYFKKEAIGYAWEFVIQRLGLSPEQLWITIFLDDDEAFDYWRKVGVPPERIVRQGEQHNFWGPAAETGPCGPCSEIVYDFGEEFSCGKPTCGPACDCDRFLEIWNLVFMQYYQDADGHRTPLPKKNIDTGMGLERITTVVQGKTSFYDTDLFVPIIQRVSELTGARYGEDETIDRAMRVIAEHGRAATFLIGDGVIPSNEGRGYVLRRVLRRAARFGKTLGIDGSFLAEVAKVIIGNMGHLYPELAENRDFILRVIESEEARFSETLNTGLNLLTGIMEEAERREQRTISGEEVFFLYDTYGFPKELTAEIAAENGLSVDWDRFEKDMTRQRERARASQRFGLGEKPTVEAYQELGLVETRFVGYDKLKIKALLTHLMVGGKSVERAVQGQDVEVILAETPFYGEMGGQVGDTGELRSGKGRVVITDTTWPSPELIVHQGRVVEGDISVGDSVEAEIDAARRLDIARNHTATHLLQAALRQVLGSHVRQSGSLVAPDRFRFDFAHLAAITKEELDKIQHQVNEKMRQNLSVTNKTVPYAQAREEGALAFFGEKYGEEVRVVEIRDATGSIFSSELCGGTHVAATGEIGLFQIMSQVSIGAGMRRIEAVTGRGAEGFVEQRLSTIESIAQQLQTSPKEIESKLSLLLAELDQERKRFTALRRELSRKKVEPLADKFGMVQGIPVNTEVVSVSDMEELRDMGDWLKGQRDSAAIVLGAEFNNRANFVAMGTPDLVAKGFHAGKLVNQIAAVTGGGGGGSAVMGQGGGKDKSKIDEALKKAPEVIAEQIRRGSKG